MGTYLICKKTLDYEIQNSYKYNNMVPFWPFSMIHNIFINICLLEIWMSGNGPTLDFFNELHYPKNLIVKDCGPIFELFQYFNELDGNGAIVPSFNDPMLVFPNAPHYPNDTLLLF